MNFLTSDVTSKNSPNVTNAKAFNDPTIGKMIRHKMPYRFIPALNRLYPICKYIPFDSNNTAVVIFTIEKVINVCISFYERAIISVVSCGYRTARS